MSEEYSVGYSEGYQAGWNAAIEATPPAVQPAPAQKPVTDTEQINRGCWNKTDLTTPPAAQRQWVELTEDERTEIRREHYARTLPLMDAIEAKLREKNGGAA